MLHEMGHLLGVPHIEDDPLMRPSLQPWMSLVTTPTPAAIRARQVQTALKPSCPDPGERSEGSPPVFGSNGLSRLWFSFFSFSVTVIPRRISFMPAMKSKTAKPGAAAGKGKPATKGVGKKK